MKTGRRPKPDAVKQAAGNPGKRKRHDAPAEPAPAAASGLAAPSQLSHRAKSMWRQIAPELEAMRLLRVTDRHAFGRYCDALARWYDVGEKLRTEGVTYLSQSNHGDLKRINPLFLIEERLTRRLTDLEDRFGLSPAARQQILARMAQQQPNLPFGPPAAEKTDPATPPAPQADPLTFFSGNQPIH